MQIYQKGVFIDIVVTPHGRHGVSNDNPTICSTAGLTTKKTPYFRIIGPESLGARVDSPHKGPVMQKAFPCHDVIMELDMSAVGQSWEYFYVVSVLQMAFSYLFYWTQFCILIQISIKSVLHRPVDEKSSLVQVMDWCRADENTLPYPVITQFIGAKMHSHYSLLWRHDKHDGVSNHQPHDCLLNRSFRRRSKNTSKLRVTGLCAAS